MVGAILVGDLDGKDDHLLGKNDLLKGKGGGNSAPLPLLLVGDGQSGPDQDVPENVFVVKAHQMFLQQVNFMKIVLDFYIILDYESLIGVEQYSHCPAPFPCVERWTPSWSS